MAQERRFKKQMEESGREEFTRRELVEHLLEVIEMEIWDLADGDLEELAGQFGIKAESFKHGIFFVKTLDKDDD
jgi:hypothetical protein